MTATGLLTTKPFTQRFFEHVEKTCSVQTPRTWNDLQDYFLLDFGHPWQLCSLDSVVGCSSHAPAMIQPNQNASNWFARIDPTWKTLGVVGGAAYWLQISLSNVALNCKAQASQRLAMAARLQTIVGYLCQGIGAVLQGIYVLWVVLSAAILMPLRALNYCYYQLCFGMSPQMQAGQQGTYERELATLVQKQNNQTSQIEGLGQTLTEVKQSEEALQKDSLAQQEQLKALATEKAALEQTLTEVKQSKETLQKDSLAQQEQLTTLKEQNAALETLNASLQQPELHNPKHTELHNMVDISYQLMISNLQNEINEINEERDLLMQNLAAKDNKLREKQIECEALQQTEKALQNELNALNNCLKDSHNERENLEERYNQLKQSEKMLQATLKKTNMNFDALVDKHQELATSFFKLENACAVSRNEIKEKQEQLDSLRTKNQELVTHCHELESHGAALQIQLKEREKQLQEKQEQLSTSHGTWEHLSHQNQQLMQEKQSLEMQLNDANERQAKLQYRIGELEAKLTSTENFCNDQNMLLQRQTEQLSLAEKEKTNLLRQSNDLAEQLARQKERGRELDERCSNLSSALTQTLKDTSEQLLTEKQLLRDSQQACLQLKTEHEHLLTQWRQSIEESDKKTQEIQWLCQNEQELERKIEAHEQALKEERKALEDADMEAGSLRQSKQERENKIQELEQKLKDKVQELEEERRDKQKILESLQTGTSSPKRHRGFIFFPGRVNASNDTDKEDLPSSKPVSERKSFSGPIA